MNRSTELEALLLLDVDKEIPPGFADRVMDRIEDPAVSVLFALMAKRPVQLALAHVGLAAAVVNIVRWVFALLVPTASAGGLP